MMDIEAEVLDALGGLLPGARVVHREALGERVERLVIVGESGESMRVVVKRVAPGGGWVGQATQDERMRAYRLATGGILRALPRGVDAAVLRAVPVGEGAALVQRDVSDALLAQGASYAPEQAVACLTALAQVHSTFCGFPARLTADLGLCVLGSWLTLYAPATIERAPSIPASEAAAIRSGWQAFAEAAPEAWDVLRALLDDPAPLVRGLRECSDTIAHGEATPTQLAVDNERVTLLGWGQALRAPGAIDFGTFLVGSAGRLPLHREEAIEVYRAERERLGRLPASGERWDHELALGLVAGLLRYGWQLDDETRAGWTTVIDPARYWH
jgi:hypothetical protein